MKLRIRGNSIRLRVGPTEVARLLRGETIEESTEFAGGQRLNYALRVGDVPGVTASFVDGRIAVLLPGAAAREWGAGDEVGIEGVERVGPSGSLKLLIEKDFECLRPPPDKELDEAFPHPERGSPCPTAPAVDNNRAPGD